MEQRDMEFELYDLRDPAKGAFLIDGVVVLRSPGVLTTWAGGESLLNCLFAEDKCMKERFGNNWEDRVKPIQVFSMCPSMGSLQSPEAAASS